MKPQSKIQASLHWLSILIALFMTSCKELHPENPPVSSQDQQRCEMRLLALWDAAKSYSMERNVPIDKVIPVDVISAYLAEGKEGLFCPLSQRKYPDFSLRDGPKCLAGHEIQATDVKDFRSRWLDR